MKQNIPVLTTSNAIIDALTDGKITKEQAKLLLEALQKEREQEMANASVGGCRY